MNFFFKYGPQSISFRSLFKIESIYTKILLRALVSDRSL
jgi:hypothetical protein